MVYAAEVADSNALEMLPTIASDFWVRERFICLFLLKVELYMCGHFVRAVSRHKTERGESVGILRS